jgi:hypothetical protein
MPSGGRRPGAGRPAGKPNRLTRERLEALTGMTWEEIAEQRRQQLRDMGYVEVAPEYAAAARRLGLLKK